ncbi:hypothetical protein [Paracoccus sp. (in: a-proteobacteria)]|uniref:hypothetical protein n=1 Tax=Paracoccus sp. TaxID=267 RepID=UPI002898F9A1|nr:hypothetical protein [Paracoccus sp. (in: a-proteobacteria)]
MAEPGKNASASEISENIGDVLASIRRLIAQDEANRSNSDPGTRLRQLAQQRAQTQRQTAEQAGRSLQPHQGVATARPPLMLGDDDLIADHIAPPKGGPVVFPMPDHPEEKSPAFLRAQAAPGPISLTDSGAAPTAPSQIEDRHPFTRHDIRREPGQPITLRTAPAPVIDPAVLPAIDTPPPSEGAAMDIPADATPPVAGATMGAATGATLAPEPEDVHFFATPEQSPTEALLRDLIREAIRTELQGELGGQFSRNLRRVIRSEVDLAMRQARKIA